MKKYLIIPIFIAIFFVSIVSAVVLQTSTEKPKPDQAMLSWPQWQNLLKDKAVYQEFLRKKGLTEKEFFEKQRDLRTSYLYQMSQYYNLLAKNMHGQDWPDYIRKNLLTKLSSKKIEYMSHDLDKEKVESYFKRGGKDEVFKSFALEIELILFDWPELKTTPVGKINFGSYLIFGKNSPSGKNEKLHGCVTGTRDNIHDINFNIVNNDGNFVQSGYMVGVALHEMSHCMMNHGISKPPKNESEATKQEQQASFIPSLYQVLLRPISKYPGSQPQNRDIFDPNNYK